MGFLSTVVIGSLTIGNIITLASIAFQIVQAKKARKAAKAAAEARKGFEMVVEGDISTLPIVYGKALVGGTRVFHMTASNFKYAATNADKVFNIGPPGKPAGSYNYMRYNEDTQAFEEATQTYPAVPDGYLNRDLSGNKNEFLLFQQAICQGEISRVWDIVINESQYIDDPSLGRGSAASSINPFESTVKSAFRADIHYKGGVADALMSANASQRSSALFTESAYATIAIRLDRDDPQFNGVPIVQFLVEGSKVRKVQNGALTAGREYSNNPAWCLLDYLLHARSGKNLDLSQIDLASFEQAAAVCDTIVQRNVYTGGRIYQPTDKSRNIVQRDLPLYECNIIIDVAKPIRENVEAILATMGDARLVWSSGKYKLLLQYPTSNEVISTAATITDDDIVRETPVEINWPTASERLNHCTVRFNNEAEGFKEDSVSWPPKNPGQYWKGVGGKKYTPVSGWNDNDNNKLLNSYGVWDGSGETASFRWLIIPKVTGTYILKGVIDDVGSITIIGAGTLALDGAARQTTVNLVKDTQYTITAEANNSRGGLKGMAGILISPDGNTFWTSRDDSYSAYIQVSTSNAVYLEMKQEDNNLELETDVFAEGITDYYHAIAKAEELVRTSRSAFGVKFAFAIKDRYLEPGDIVKIQSETLKLGLSGDLFVRVNEVKVSENGNCEVSGTRFDWTQLAWNVKDDEYLRPGNAYEFTIPAPQELTFKVGNNEIKGSAGTLEWSHVSDSRRVGYALYAHVAGDMGTDGRPVFNEIGRATSNKFALTSYIETSMIFGVKTVSSTGAMSSMTVTSYTSAELLIGPKPPTVTTLGLVVAGDQRDSVKVNWVIPAKRADNTDYSDHYVTNIFRSKTNNFATAKRVAQVEGTEFTERPTEFGNLFYWVQLVSLRAVRGDASASATINVKPVVIGEDLTPTPTPTGFAVTALFSNYQLMWDNPVYTIGGGHSRTLIYAREWPENTAQPAFSESFLVGSAIGTIHNYPGKLGTRMIFWVSWQSLGGGKSAVPAGPIAVKTGLIGNADLGDLIIEADNIAENGVNLSKFAEGIEPVKIVTSLPITKQTEVVVFEGKIYRWNVDKYTAEVATVDLTGQITNTQISDDSISTPKLRAGSISTDKLAANAVTAGKIAADSIVAGHLQAGIISTDKLAANAVTADKIAANAIVAGSAAIANGAIRNALIENGAIDNAKIANAAITTAKIGEAQVDTLRIGPNMVTVPSGATGVLGQVAATYVYMEHPGRIMLIVTANWQAQNNSLSTGTITPICAGQAGPAVSISMPQGFSGAATAMGIFDVPAGNHYCYADVSNTGQRIPSSNGIIAIGIKR